MAVSSVRRELDGRAVIVDTIYSSTDGGYYCEVWQADSGKEIFSSPVCATREEAFAIATDFIDGEQV